MKLLKYHFVFQRQFFLCRGYKTWTAYGYEYDCDYENAGSVFCEDCICAGGKYNPETGKKDYIKWFLNKIGILKIIIRTAKSFEKDEFDKYYIPKPK